MKNDENVNQVPTANTKNMNKKDKKLVLKKREFQIKIILCSRWNGKIIFHHSCLTANKYL